MAQLRAVHPRKAPAKPVKPLTVEQAAASNDHFALLLAMRERIARAVTDPGCPPRDLATLCRRLQDVSREVEAIGLRRKDRGRLGERAGDTEFDAASL